MIKKNGFISISIIYSFFIVFMLLLLLIMQTYINNRFNFTIYINDIKKRIPENTSMVLSTLSETLLSLESNSEYTSSQSGGGVFKINFSLGGGIRYQGKNPDNYVTFNNEEWRIIGTFEGSTIGLESGKYYTKLIKNTSIGSMRWDWEDADGDGTVDSGEYLNNWKEATLNTYLNTTYLNSMTSTARGMLVTPTYYLGAHSTSDVYTPAMYGYERGSTVAGASGSVASINDKKIGLMYPSDYGYAAYGRSCNNISSMTLYNYGEGCHSVDWLFSDLNEWTITPYSGHAHSAFYVSSSGNVFSGERLTIHIVSTAYAVRPVLYLNSEVLVASGNGSKTSPYVLE